MGKMKRTMVKGAQKQMSPIFVQFSRKMVQMTKWYHRIMPAVDPEKLVVNNSYFLPLPNFCAPCVKWQLAPLPYMAMLQDCFGEIYGIYGVFPLPNSDSETCARSDSDSM